MATKKVAPKKPAKATKTAKPIRHSVGKAAVKSAHSANKKANKTKAAQPVTKKVVKKAAPIVKKSASKKPLPVKTVTKSSAKTLKTVKPSKTAKTPAAKKPLAKSVPKQLPKAVAKPVVKHPVKAEPVKKPTVSARTQPEIKPAIKPLEKQVKKEPAKPTKVVIPKTSTDKAIKYEPDFTKSVLDRKKTESLGPTMRYSDSELTEFRDLINKKLDTAKKELAYLQGLITRKDESGDLDEGRYMTMEDGSMSMEREQLSQMASRQIQFIDHLEKAIMRIENKTYGICRVTGKLIEKARLRAVPHATLSIEAKQMMNK